MAIPSRPTTLDDGRGWNIADPVGVKRRAWGCGVVLLLAFGGLVTRLWYLQVVRGPDLLAQAQSNRLRRVPLPAPRGLILDRKGRVLATSRAEHSVAVVPAALPSHRTAPQDRARLLKTLAFLLGITPGEIEDRLDDAARKGSHPYDPVKIAEDVDLRTVTLIEENQPRLGSDQRAVLVTDDLARYYPNKSLACHVLGYTGVVTREDLAQNREQLAAQHRDSDDADTPDSSSTPSDAAVRPVSYLPGKAPTGDGSSAGQAPPRELAFDDVIGKGGVERSYDALLSGRRGADVYEVDARLRPVRKKDTEPEQAGRTLKLTIDADLQRAAEDALSRARNSGAAVAIDPRNGDVLAMVSRPGFDPNMWSLDRKAFNRAYRQLQLDPKHPEINRAVTSRFPPGSTFKMVTASAGLQRGTLHPTDTVVCNGGLRLGRWFGCWGHHGAVNLQSALAKSCDVYFYQQALRMGNPESSGPTYLASVARQFGLGSRTGIDLPIDGAGLIPDPAWRKRINRRHPALEHWFPGNTLNMSIGQGDVLTTPLQMAMVTATVANGGTVYKPHLLKSVIDPHTGHELAGTPASRKVGIKPEYLALVRQGMRAVVAQGTGRVVALPNVEVAGKTGSAEDDRHGLPHAWFVCFAPYQNPQIAIAVIVENSGHGATNAAPVAKAILEARFPQAKSSR